MDFANILPGLFVEIVDPELQSSKRVSGSLFEHSVAAREKLCKF